MLVRRELSGRSSGELDDLLRFDSLLLVCFMADDSRSDVVRRDLVLAGRIEVVRLFNIMEADGQTASSITASKECNSLNSTGDARVIVTEDGSSVLVLAFKSGVSLVQ